MIRAALAVLIVTACGGRVSYSTEPDVDGTAGAASPVPTTAGAAGAPKLCEDVRGVPYECPPEFRDPEFNIDQERKGRGGASGAR